MRDLGVSRNGRNRREKESGRDREGDEEEGRGEDTDMKAERVIQGEGRHRQERR